MKLADDALVQIIEILRQGLAEGRDVSVLLRSLDLEVNSSGRLTVIKESPNAWTPQARETD